MLQNNNRFPAPPELPARKKRPIRKLMARTALALAVVGPPTAAITYTRDANPIAALETVTDMARARWLGENYCPPAPSAYKRHDMKQRLQGPPSSDFLTAQNKAKERGLHFVDAQLVSDQFQKINQAQDAKTATAAMSSYTREHYGFSVNLKIPESTFEPADAVKDYKYGLQWMVSNLYLMPTELIRQSNVHTLNVRQLVRKTGKSGTFNPPDNPHNPSTVDIDINYLNDTITLYHEFIGHGLQNTACQGFFDNDDPVAQFNPPEFHYNSRSKGENAYPSVVASSYGQLNVKEDEAMLVEAYLIGYDPSAPDIFATNTPASEKLSVIFDRIDTLAPGSVEYLNSARYALSEQRRISDLVPDYGYIQAS